MSVPLLARDSDIEEANAKAAKLQAQWMERFDEQRKALNSLRVEHITTEMGRLLAERVTRLRRPRVQCRHRVASSLAATVENRRGAMQSER